MKLVLAVTLFAFGCAARAANPSATAANDFTGHYELTNPSGSAFSLDVQQTGKTATTSFSAGAADGSGAAPDGDGDGELNAKGELTIAWTDSFENGGTAVLRRDGRLFHLSMTSTKVEDPRALTFYGEVELERTQATPPTEAP